MDPLDEVVAYAIGLLALIIGVLALLNPMHRWGRRDKPDGEPDSTDRDGRGR